MDVKLPSGRVIKNVPDGMSQADLQTKLLESGAATEQDFNPVVAERAASMVDDIPAMAGSVAETAGNVLGGMNEAAKPFYEPYIDPVMSLMDEAKPDPADLASRQGYDWMDVASNQLQSVGEGLSFGYRDELEAGLAGLYDDRPYDQRLATIEGRRQDYTDAYPMESAAAEGFGALGTGALGAGLFNPSTWLGASAIGAGEGALYGYGKDRGEGALVGGLMGAAAPVVAMPFGRVAYNSARDILTAGKKTADKVGDYIQDLSAKIKGDTAMAKKVREAARSERDIPMPKYVPEEPFGINDVLMPQKGLPKMAKKNVPWLREPITPAGMPAVTPGLAGTGGAYGGLSAGQYERLTEE